MVRYLWVILFMNVGHGSIKEACESATVSSAISNYSYKVAS